ncbi:MAG: AAA family ATPase, partial [Butyricicoccus sp.]
MKHEQPRLLIAGTGSGCGKTTVSSALLRAWQRQGVDLCAFKCGPDYIDPMFHREALGLPSYNLDLFFLQEQEVCELLSCHLSGGRVGVV